MLVCESGEWKMMTVDESKPRGRAPPFCQRLLKMAPFHIVIQLLVLVNAIVAASMHFDHRTAKSHNDPYTWYYYTEVSRLCLIQHTRAVQINDCLPIYRSQY